MTEEQIKHTVRGLLARRIVTATMVPADMIGMVFMTIGLGGLGDIDLDTVGNIIEDLDKACERSINGYPVFMSCRVVHRDDWAVITERVVNAEAVLDRAVEGNNS